MRLKSGFVAAAIVCMFIGCGPGADEDAVEATASVAPSEAALSNAPPVEAAGQSNAATATSIAKDPNFSEEEKARCYSQCIVCIALRTQRACSLCAICRSGTPVPGTGDPGGLSPR
jgi:hypothetical protein